MRESPSVRTLQAPRAENNFSGHHPLSPPLPRLGLKTRNWIVCFYCRHHLWNSAGLLCYLFHFPPHIRPQAGAKMAAAFRPSQPDPDPEKQATLSWVNLTSGLLSTVIGQHRPQLSQSLAKRRGLPGRLGPIRTCSLGLW